MRPGAVATWPRTPLEVVAYQRIVVERLQRHYSAPDTCRSSAVAHAQKAEQSLILGWPDDPAPTGLWQPLFRLGSRQRGRSLG